jgi:hypothetical protein
VADKVCYSIEESRTFAQEEIVVTSAAGPASTASADAQKTRGLWAKRLQRTREPDRSFRLDAEICVELEPPSRLLDRQAGHAKSTSSFTSALTSCAHVPLENLETLLERSIAGAMRDVDGGARGKRDSPWSTPSERVCVRLRRTKITVVVREYERRACWVRVGVGEALVGSSATRGAWASESGASPDDGGARGTSRGDGREAAVLA